MILFDLHTCCLYVRTSCCQLLRGQLHSKTIISDLVDFFQSPQRWRLGVEIQTETPSNTPKLAKTKTQPIAMWCHNRCQASRIWGCGMILNSTVRPRFTAVVLLRSESGWSWTLRIGPGTLHGHKVAPLGPVRIRHSSHDFGWQSSHSVDLAGWQAKMASIEIWIPWRDAHKPHYNHVHHNRWHYVTCVFFFFFCISVWPSLHSNFDLRPSLPNFMKRYLSDQIFWFCGEVTLNLFPTNVPTREHDFSHFLSCSYWKWRNFTSFKVETYSLISIRLSVVKWWLCVYNLQPNASNCTRIAPHTRPFLNAWRLAGQVVNIQVELVCCALLINLWIFLPIDPN